MKKEIRLLILSFALPFTAALGATAHFSLGIPGAPEMRVTANASQNDWLSANTAYAAMSVVSPGSPNAVSAVTIAGLRQVKLSAAEAGFALERTKPEYYLCDRIVPPGGVDWPATYELFVANPSQGFLFDPSGEAVYAAAGGNLSFTWVLTDGSQLPTTYVVAPSCMGRPRRIYWTDPPYNAPGIDLSGKFVKFFGSEEILGLRKETVTNLVAGVEQVVSNNVVSGAFTTTRPCTCSLRKAKFRGRS